MNWHPDFAFSETLGAALGGATEPPAGWMIPFVCMLAAIAVMPFLNKAWWEHHYPKVALALGGVVAGFYLFGLGRPDRMVHALHEYFSFMALIGSLFVVAGGIHLQVQGEATPRTNLAFLFVGAVLANLIGTTGASMLLIRPWIRINRYRITGFHVVFFIFVVSNVGGCLTPIGDPPLFLGYLNGIPFFWTLQHLWIPWITAIGLLLLLFWILDQSNFKRAPRPVRNAETAHRSWGMTGRMNVVWLAVILGAVFVRQPAGLSEALMIGAAIASWKSTPPSVHQANEFSFAPVKEVAWLFLGIFLTMPPALDYLSSHAASLGLNSAQRLYWSAGALSSVLDNAPTYLTFLAASMGRAGLSLAEPGHVAQLLSRAPQDVIAISLGAVLFGAMTYIGNGPNFMVKAIAEQSSVRTPGFFGYIFRFSLPYLLPVLVVIAWMLKSFSSPTP